MLAIAKPASISIWLQPPVGPDVGIPPSNYLEEKIEKEDKVEGAGARAAGAVLVEEEV